MIKTYIVDSFTDEAFKGNPAGVCLLEQEMNAAKMLAIAKELGLSETAFVRKLDKENYYSIRFFSPKMEIPLCGHATLASSKVIFERCPNRDELHFITNQHLDLKIQKDETMILMEFPSYDTRATDVPVKLLDAIGLKSVINSVYNEEAEVLLLEIEDSELLKNLHPDFEALYRSHDAISGVLVTAPSKQAEFDFESRYFWPWSGTNEDPVTGGTHTFLTKYWSTRLGKTQMKSFQCSERSGFMEVALKGAHNITIKSKAVIVFEGYLRL